jgi:hypothetical protein
MKVFSKGSRLEILIEVGFEESYSFDIEIILAFAKVIFTHKISGLSRLLKSGILIDESI